jgi:hypothetical protein
MAVWLTVGLVGTTQAEDVASGGNQGANTTLVSGSLPLPAAMSPAVEVVPEPVPLPSDAPERHAQDTLRAYLTQAEPARLDSLSTLKFDRTQITERMNVLAKTGAEDELVDTYLYYLTAYPPDPKNYLDVMAKLATVLSERNNDAGVLTLLYQEGERFPPSAPQMEQLQLGEAEYLLRVGLTQSALVKLHQIGDEPGIPPAARVLAIGRAGFLHERLGQNDEALKAYLKTADFLTTTTQANEAMLRAAVLLLEMGRTDEAISVIGKLKAVPPDILLQSPAEGAVTEMLQLTADPAAAKAYWSHGDQWYPQWEKLAALVGVKADDETLTLGPSSEDYQRLGVEGNLALSGRDRDRYFEIVNLLMNSARWRPSDLADAMSLLFQGLRLAPERADDFLALAAAMENGLPPGQRSVAKQVAQLRVGTLIDTGHPDQAQALAAAALAQYGSDGSQGQALARLYGYAVVRANSATSPNGADAIRVLSDTMKDPDAHGQQRALAMEVLCQLYLSVDREDEARAVLQRELSGTPRESTGGERYFAALRDLLERLQQQRAQMASMDAGLSAWWAQYSLPWYGYVTTPPQAGPLSVVDDPAVQVARDFARALDVTAPLESRASALVDAWSPYPMMPLSGSAVAAATADFVGRAELPDQLRYVAWAKTMWHLLWTGQRDAAEKLLAAAPATQQAADDRPSLDLWLEYLALPCDVAAQQAFVDKLLAQPKLNRFGLVLVVRVIEAMARLGAPDAAEAVFKKLQGAGMDDSAQEQFHDLRDNIEPLIAQYRATQPAYEKLRAIVLEEQAKPAAAAQLPARWRDLNDPEQPDLDLLTMDEARQGLLTVIRDRLPYGRHPLQVFLDYGEVLPVDADNNALRFRLFEAVQQEVTRDDDRFYAAMFTELVDFDDVDMAKRGWAALATSENTSTYPKTADFLQYYNALMVWRGGSTLDLTAAFGPLDAPGLDAYKLRMVLEFYTQRGDLAALQKLRQERPEADFLQPMVLGAYLKVLRLQGDDTALARASEAARLELAKDVVQSWAKPERDLAAPVFDLAEGMKDPAAYPRAWADYLAAQVHNENSRDLNEMDDARLQGDWPGLLAAAQDFLSRNPTQYDYYWAEAKALIELGRPAEAVAPLRVYVKYSRNDQDYPEAVEWLKKLEAAPAPTAATVTPAATAPPAAAQSAN